MGNLKNSAPRGVHPSGDKQKILDQVTREIVNSDDPYKEPVFKGVVVYSSFLTERDFRSKYDKDFVEFVLKTNNVKKDQKRIIIESIVYIDKISGVLPRPDPTQEIEFYNYLKKLTPNDNQEGFDAIAKKSKKMSAKNLKYLEMIKRYPRAYSVVMGSKGSKTGFGIGERVTVKFPYDYDVHAGSIVSTSAEGQK